jgi:prevent-host-death family protein
MSERISIKELHALTGEYVRRAGSARTPLIVTDRGEPVAVLASLALLKRTRARKRTLSPEFEAMMSSHVSQEEDLESVRGDR